MWRVGSTNRREKKGKEKMREGRTGYRYRVFVVDGWNCICIASSSSSGNLFFINVRGRVASVSFPALSLSLLLFEISASGNFLFSILFFFFPPLCSDLVLFSHSCLCLFFFFFFLRNRFRFRSLSLPSSLPPRFCLFPFLPFFLSLFLSSCSFLTIIFSFFEFFLPPLMFPVPIVAHASFLPGPSSGGSIYSKGIPNDTISSRS